MAVHQVGNLVEYMCKECGSQGMISANAWTYNRSDIMHEATEVTCPVCGRTARAVFRPLSRPRFSVRPA